MVSHDFRQLISFFALLKLIVLYHLQSPKVLLLHFKRFIVTQELKAGQSSGENSDENEKKQSRMEMVLRKNEVRHFTFALLWTGGPSSHPLIISVLFRQKYHFGTLFQFIHLSAMKLEGVLLQYIIFAVLFTMLEALLFPVTTQHVRKGQ